MTTRENCRATSTFLFASLGADFLRTPLGRFGTFSGNTRHRGLGFFFAPHDTLGPYELHIILDFQPNLLRSCPTFHVFTFPTLSTFPTQPLFETNSMTPCISVPPHQYHDAFGSGASLKRTTSAFSRPFPLKVRCDSGYSGSSAPTPRVPGRVSAHRCSFSFVVFAIYVLHCEGSLPKGASPLLFGLPLKPATQPRHRCLCLCHWL